MINKISIVSFIFLNIISRQVLAVPETVVLDLLSLPAQNRKMILSDLPQDQFKKLTEIAFSENQSMRVRWRALLSLAEANPAKANQFLEKAATDKNWYMRNAAMVATQEFNPQNAEALALKLIKDKALVVRSAAVEALKKNMTLEAREILWAELEKNYNFRGTESLWVRAQIVNVLALKPLDREKVIFSQLLSDKDERVHTASIAGLEKITGIKLGGEEASAKKLVSLWKDYLVKNSF